MMDIKDLQSKFAQAYGDNYDTSAFFSPGRVNLIGEHTDYNGGYVFPCALSFGTYAVARKRSGNVMKFASSNFSKKVEASLDDLVFKPEDDWANYLKGVAYEIIQAGHELGGFEIFIEGNIPNGAGLSSSASIELLMAVALDSIFGLGIGRVELVKLCQKSENEFVGLNCGIMDQYACGMGKAGHAIFLDCKTITHEYVPLDLKGRKLVIANTNKRRGLTDSKYNERRAECEFALSQLNANLPGATCLGDISIEEFEANSGLITNPLAFKRARHIIYEDARVKKSVSLLKSGELLAFGELMRQAHESMRDDFEATGPELDALVEEAWKTPGVVGARMTGAGFGGCAVAIVDEDAIENFKKEVGEGYTKRIGLVPDFYVADVGDGTYKLF
ncbi:MAG: galactokinase [Clostridiales bacterium]|nr:galactokinase [Clostridiales bacterium]